MFCSHFSCTAPCCSAPAAAPTRTSGSRSGSAAAGCRKSVAGSAGSFLCSLGSVFRSHCGTAVFVSPGSHSV